MLNFHNVSKHYKVHQLSNNKHKVLDNVSFSVEDGDFVSIVGPSGCGKTTLINLITGLNKPSSGSILINGKAISGVGSDRTLVFQEGGLFPWLNVRQNIEFALKVKSIGIPRSQRKAIIDRYIDMVGLTNYDNYRIHELSGGMKQRVAIARALSVESEILLMDEPFGALDPSMKQTLHTEILKIWHDTHKTIIFITHDIEEAVTLAKKVIVLGYAPNNIKAIIDITSDYPRVHNEQFNEYVNNIKEIIARSSQ